MTKTVKKRMDIKSRLNVAVLGYGIHDNVAIEDVDVSNRNVNGKQPDTKMIYITFTKVDPETRDKKSSVELKWFKPNPKNEYTYTNMQELFLQLHNILSCYMTSEEAFEVFNEAISESEFKNLDTFKKYSWTDKKVNELMEIISESFYEAMKPFIGLDKDLIRVKITSDSKGEYSNIPKYGKFVEPMTVESTNLRFSTYELASHAKSNGVAKLSSSELLNQMD